jgi:hypothetical protein
VPQKLYFILQGAQIGLNNCLISDFIVTAEQLKNFETGGRSYSNLFGQNIFILSRDAVP